jgi:L-amino acid N-acyltransferase YncA
MMPHGEDGGDLDDGMFAGQATRVEVRAAREGDLSVIQAIYAMHVLRGTGTFEESPPDEREIAARRRAIVGRGLPYLVATVDGHVRGFAYAGPFRTRSAYRFTVEDSIYVHPKASGRGLGTTLLGRLIDVTADLGYRQMLAVIGDSANTPSIRLHSRLAFRHAGVLRADGFKFGRWLDAVFMQRALGSGDLSAP